MVIFYDLDPQLGDKMAQSIRTNCVKIRLPTELWNPAVDAVAKRAKFADVKAAAIKMNEGVTDYLKQGAGLEAK